MIEQKFTDKGSTALISVTTQLLSFFYQLSGTFNGILNLVVTTDGGQSFQVVQSFTSGSGYATISPGAGLYAFQVQYGVGHGSLTGTAFVTLNTVSTTNLIPVSSFATPASQPSSGAIQASAIQVADKITITLSLSAARFSVVRNANGSFASIPLMTVLAASLSFIACKQNYIGYVEGAALTGGAGNAQFAIGVGTAAVPSEENGVLDFHSQNIGTAIQETNVGGTSTGQRITTGIDVDASSAATNLFLNFAGTAATILANDFLDVTGTVTIVLQQI